MIRHIMLAALMTAAALSPSAAQELDQPSGWQTMSWDGSCFAVLFPEAPTLKELRSPKAYAAIKHTPAEGTVNAISFVSGLEEDGLKGVADIDGKTFDLLTYEATGFVSSGQRENDLLAAMVAGKELKITWTSPESLTIQAYKLPGLDKAKATIDTACATNAT